MSLRSDPKPRSGTDPKGVPTRTSAPALGPVEFARWLWRTLTSMRTALVLLFLLALAAVPGSLIPQQKVDPTAVSAFRRSHQSLAPWYDRIGMFHVYTSTWFSAIYLLLMVSLIGCFLPRLRVYARAARARPPRAPANLRRLSASDSFRTDESPQAVAERASVLLGSQRRRVDVYNERDPAKAGAVVVTAEKGYLREAGNLLFHFAVLVVLVGVAVTSLWGFKGSVVVVQGGTFSNTLIQYDDFTSGGRFKPESLAPFAFTIKAFNVSYETSGPGRGTPTQFAAGLTVTDRPGERAHPYDLRVNHPLTVDGTSVYLVGHGYAPVVTVRDRAGRVVYSGPVVFLPLDGSFTSYGIIKAPDAKPTQLGFEGYFFPTAVLAANNQPASSFPAALNPRLSLIAYHGDLGLDNGIAQSVYVLDKSKLTPYRSPNGQPRALLMKPGDTVKLKTGDLTDGSITFDGVKQWAKLQVSRSPGKVLPLTGVMLAIAGLLGSLFIRPRRTWVRATRADGRTLVEVAALDRVSGGSPGEHVEQVAAQLRGMRRPDRTSGKDRS
jgi:cytochrome c biogenesis protein